MKGEQTDPNAIIYNQTPKADFSIPQNSTIILYTDENRAETLVTMPDLKDRTVSEAIEALERLGLNIRIRGSGMVQKQEYPAGTQLKKGQVVEVSFVEMIGD